MSLVQQLSEDALTRSYIARRVAEGKTTREATRILKRYLARHLYCASESPMSVK